ncbi:MAG: hypothetical protein DSY42_01105 [Aquifex sp.]|nr:MAG: hypothetical protein DSY42_01105 [Aquifex sp.]
MKRGFTLTELVIALVILALLVTVFAGGIKNTTRSAKYAEVRDAVNHIFKGVYEFARDVGRYPNNLRELVNGSGITGWRGTYVSIQVNSNGIAEKGGVRIGYRIYSGNTSCGNLNNRPALIIYGKGNDVVLQRYLENYCLVRSGNNLIVVLR